MLTNVIFVSKKSIKVYKEPNDYLKQKEGRMLAEFILQVTCK